MYFPLISRRSTASQSDTTRSRKRRRNNKEITARKSGNGNADPSSPSSGTFAITTGTGSHNASVTSFGGGPSKTIPKDHTFAGRVEGGGARNTIFGTNEYGSGYANIPGRGTAGRHLPFYFWPVVWQSGPDYLHPREYDSSGNHTRPGGELATAAFPLKDQSMTLRVLSDDATVVALIPQIANRCFVFIRDAGQITPTPFDHDSSLPKPEQAIQYYRASSIALTLDGQNDTAALSADNTTSSGRARTLPPGVNTNFLYCVNNTIGTYAPLVQVEMLGLSTVHSSASSSKAASPTGKALSGSRGLADSVPGFVSLAWLAWVLFALL